MKTAAPYLYKLLLLNLCFTVGWGLGTPAMTSLDLSSKEERGFSLPFRLSNNKNKDSDKKSKDDGSSSNQEETAPVIEHALDQIDRAKQVQNLIGKQDMTSNRNCEDCERELRSIRYMQCNRQNDYLENELEKLGQGHTLFAQLATAKIERESIIKPACMRMSMEAKFSASSKVFRQCSPEGTGSAAFRPCISENYFKLINNSFDLVSSCMKDIMAPEASDETQKLDVRAVYALINVESGFHVNAMSGTGAGGIGQFTTPAIQDVNQNELRNIRISLENNPNPQCGRLSMEFLDSLEPIRPQKAHSCDRISLSNGNPIKNMIYTYAYLKGVKKDLSTMIFENRNYKNKFKLSEFDLNKVKRALMVWSHNTGPAGTWTPAKTLLNTFYRNRPVTDADEFINQLQQYMQKFPASANKSPARRKETSRYFPEITSTLTNIEKNVGGGSCVNF
ncbi:MAG: transglycosylase SLT domain-containing protein [Bdellovibrio sp.]|uniref:transglycosylase SLT domain-containing protein n=1 Tax=Bdellovibrio sp. TaxID=28201 RepID=UPI0039E492E6|nr:transglycosylase SLT domain-containing protein [Bdellovibrio sp.]